MMGHPIGIAQGIVDSLETEARDPGKPGVIAEVSVEILLSVNLCSDSRQPIYTYIYVCNFRGAVT